MFRMASAFEISHEQSKMAEVSTMLRHIKEAPHSILHCTRKLVIAE